MTGQDDDHISTVPPDTVPPDTVLADTAPADAGAARTAGPDQPVGVESAGRASLSVEARVRPSKEPLLSLELVEVLRANASTMTTRALGSMEHELPWFTGLSAEQRSWITLVARSGIDGFLEWVQHRRPRPGDRFDASSVFSAAPSALTGDISLHQTVELVRTTVEAVEQALTEFIPASEQALTHVAILTYSREVAFAAAEVYARAAEARGAWDARLEALVVDSIVRAEGAGTVMSRASAFGWQHTAQVCVVVGSSDGTPSRLPDLRRRARRSGLDCLVASQGERLILVIGGPSLINETAAIAAVSDLAEFFGPGHVVVGPSVASLAQAATSARAAISGLRAAIAWPEGERVVSAAELLPERALAGDGHARRSLVQDVYLPLVEAGGDLLITCVTFLDHGSSVEATARALFVHANTVRYRLKRIQEVTGYSPNDARDAYVLRLAITLGRLARL